MNNTTNRMYLSSLRPGDVYSLPRSETRYLVVGVTTRGGQTSVSYQLADNPYSVWTHNAPSLTSVNVHN